VAALVPTGFSRHDVLDRMWCYSACEYNWRRRRWAALAARETTDIDNRRRMKLTRLLVLAGTLVAAQMDAAPSAAAWTNQALTFGQPSSNGYGGPVLSPDIVPLYWGKQLGQWQTGDIEENNNPDTINAYIDGFANYISGSGAPAGLEPVVKQYGVWGAARYGGNFTCTGSCSSGDQYIADAGIQARIQHLQSTGVLPPSTPNRIFVIFLQGFSYAFTAAYHQSFGNTYYVVIPYEYYRLNPNGYLYGQSFQQALSLGLLEAMTDPYVGQGWFSNSVEGATECVPYPSSAGPGVGAAGITQFPWRLPNGNAQAFTQTFADNTSGTCVSWSRATTSTIAASNWPQNGELLSVFVPTPGGAALRHAYTGDGVHWSSESVASPFSLVQAPSVVKSQTNKIDVFARGIGAPLAVGTNSFLEHFSKTTTAGWVTRLIPDSTMAQPSAVSTAPGRIDLAARRWDASVIHYWSNDDITFFGEALNSQTVGPPLIVSPGYFNFDIYTFGEHLDQVVDSQLNGHPFGGFGVLEAGINGMLPMPPTVAVVNGTEKIVFADLNGGNTASFAERQTYLPRYTITNTNGSWTNTYYNLGGTTPFGAQAVIANASGVDVAWLDRGTGSYWHWHFDATTHSWGQINNTANWDPIQNLGGVWINPPVMTYGSDGFAYVLGVDLNDCLQTVQVVGPSIFGNFTGICGVL
jgi:hypothetical protein